MNSTIKTLLDYEDLQSILDGLSVNNKTLKIKEKKGLLYISTLMKPGTTPIVEPFVFKGEHLTALSLLGSYLENDEINQEVG